RCGTGGGPGRPGALIVIGRRTIDPHDVEPLAPLGEKRAGRLPEEVGLGRPALVVELQRLPVAEGRLEVAEAGQDVGAGWQSPVADPDRAEPRRADEARRGRAHALDRARTVRDLLDIYAWCQVFRHSRLLRPRRLDGRARWGQQ